MKLMARFPILLCCALALSLGCHDSGRAAADLGDAGGTGGTVTSDAAADTTGATGGSGGGQSGGTNMTGGNGGAGAGGGGKGGTSDRGGTGGKGGAGGAGGGPVTCSSLPNVPCPSGQICDYNTPNRCSAGYQPGHCLVPPDGCLTDYNPVCGCDGKTYSNDCERVRARAQLDHPGACGGMGGAGSAGGAGGNGTAACGSCDITTTYCQITVGGVVGASPSHRCQQLPTSCASAPTCACIMSNGCALDCTGSSLSGFTATCYAP